MTPDEEFALGCFGLCFAGLAFLALALVGVSLGVLHG